MTTKIEKNLIISLIKDDLLNYKFVSGLQSLGIDASAYCLNLSESIFYLLDIHSDHVTDEYLKISKKVEQIDVNDEEKMNALISELLEIIGF